MGLRGTAARAAAVVMVGALAAGAPGAARGAERLVYHRGPVLTHPSRTYIISWQGPSGALPANYVNDLAQFLTDWSGTTTHGVLTQYYQRAAGEEHVSNHLSLGGVTTDGTGFAGNPLTESDLRNELLKVVQANHWPEGYGANYVVLLPAGEGVRKPGDCAWHDWAADATTGAKVFYAVVPFWQQPQPRNGCVMPGGPYPHGVQTDQAIDLLSHELSEIATDPWTDHASRSLGSWFTSHGQEIGDLCVRTFGRRDPATGADVFLHHHPYLIQGEWSNAEHRCSLGLPELPRGGGGSVYPDGRIGYLHVRESTSGEVTLFAGRPDKQWYDPYYHVRGLGYRCPTGHQSVGLAGMRCHTDFFVDALTDRLLVFATDSGHYTALGRIHIGTPTATAERITHAPAYSGCGDNIFLRHGRPGTPQYTTLNLFIDGGREIPGLRIRGGHVSIIAVDGGRSQTIDCV